MEYKLIDPAVAQLSRALFLVKAVRPVRLSDRGRDWALLIEGRGFARLLQDEMLISGDLHRPVTAGVPRPRTFFSKQHAMAAARSMGLAQRRRSWAIDGESSRCRGGDRSN